VLTFLRYGYYQRALDQLACVIEPPTPLPIFPMHQLMSLDQLLGDLPPGVAERRRAANESAECDQGAGPSR
jgi:hypothetical protein